NVFEMLELEVDSVPFSFPPKTSVPVAAEAVSVSVMARLYGVLVKVAGLLAEAVLNVFRLLATVPEEPLAVAVGSFAKRMPTVPVTSALITDGARSQL